MFENWFSNDWLDQVYWHNSIWEYLIALFIIALTYCIFRLGRFYALARLKRLSKGSDNKLDDSLVKFVDGFGWPFYIYVSLFFGLASLQIPQELKQWIDWGLLLILVFYITRSSSVLFDYLFKQYLRSRHDEETIEALDFIDRLVRWVLWLVAFLFVLSNAGINVGSLVAGLGIGGIAVALALQNILSDLFSSLAIFFDRPFKPGDFIIVGQDMGVVKKVGIKTTRIQALQGEELVIPNQELAASRVQNFKRMQKRRVVINFGVTYDTPTVKLRKVPEYVKKVVENQTEIEFDRIHFKTLADWSLVFELVYYVKSADYVVHMDIQQEILLGIKQKLEEKSIEMAFPTQTVFVRQKT